MGKDPAAEAKEEDAGGGGGDGGGGGNHRVLIFCQLKGLLDLVEEELFGSMLRGVSFLRLDGSVPPTELSGEASAACNAS